jgi:hypothetical protein
MVVDPEPFPYAWPPLFVRGLNSDELPATDRVSSDAMFISDALQITDSVKSFVVLSE